jgi:hypothetical protein
VYQNNEMAAILVYGTGISSFLFKYFVLFHHPTGATDHVSENDLFYLVRLDSLLYVSTGSRTDDIINLWLKSDHEIIIFRFHIT